MAGIKGHSGPPGNQNAAGNPGGPGGQVKHGVTAFLANSKLPAKCGYISRRLRGFQAALQEALFHRGDEIDLRNSLLIQSALRHEGRVQLLQRWLRLAPAEMELADRLALLRDISQATEKRDGVLEKLGLDAAPGQVDRWPLAGDFLPPVTPPSPVNASGQPEPPKDTDE
ncbi:MAG: hypothetical protein ACR2FY_20575 [Pirellulaceae bacterium]